MGPINQLEERQRHAAVNQSSFRLLNEATHLHREGAAFTEFVCECARPTCELQLPLSVEEYEEVRGVASHFIVSPGHATTATERVVRETPRYQVVEKIQVAARMAVRLDPGPRPL